MTALICGYTCMSTYESCAQNKARNYTFPQEVRPICLEKYAFTGYYFNDRHVYNLRQSKLSKSKGEIISFKVNPAGSSYAVLSLKDATYYLKVYDLWHPDVVFHDFKLESVKPQAICYSPDSRSFAVACDNRTVLLYDTEKYFVKSKFILPFVADKIAISDNNYFLSAISDGFLRVYNIENGMLRYETQLMSEINSVVFSSGSEYMMTCTANGMVQLYDTRTFHKIGEYDSMGIASDCDFHPDIKYLAVIKNDKEIVLINRYDADDRDFIRNPEGGVTDISFVKDKDDNVYLMYNTASAVNYHFLGGLKPNYNALLSDELDSRLSDWMKRMDGETMQEYSLRVNEDSRQKQMLLLEQEIATELAGNLLEMSTVSLGGFNEETNTLALDFNTMPSIYLSVPEGKIGDFTDVDKLDFRNAKYGLTAEDTFELVYLEVYNMETGSLAVFDNRERKSLSYMKNDAAFIPLDVVQLSNMDALKLENIKEEVIETAKKGKLISDHTEISVNTKAYSSVNAEGKKILNYCVDFSYNVDAEFSAIEDFAPGKYRSDESGAAISMIKIIDKAFDNDFTQYVKPGKKVKIRITGMADKLRINGNIPYDSVYGDYINTPVYGKELFSVTVTGQTGISTNEQLAFIRAAGVRYELEKVVSSLSDMDVEYEFHIQILDKIGGEYRRITVEFDFIDVF